MQCRVTHPAPRARSIGPWGLGDIALLAGSGHFATNIYFALFPAEFRQQGGFYQANFFYAQEEDQAEVDARDQAARDEDGEQLPEQVLEREQGNMAEQ